MAITNLNEYYASKGQALPSVSQRAGLASQAGISNYTGTAQQNAILLKSLNSPTPATNVNTTTIPTNTPAPTPAPVIPVGVVTSPQNQMPLPTMPTSTTAGTLGATAGQFLTQPVVNTSADLAEANQVAQQNADLASGNYEDQVLGLINNLTNRPGELAQQYNIQQLGADQQTAKAKYDAIQLEYRRQKEAETVNPALSAEQKNARLSEIGRKESSQLADIAIDYSLKAGLFTQAKTLMDEQIKNELEPLKMKVEYYKTLKDDYSDVLNKTQTAQLNNIIRQEDRVYQEKQDQLKFNQQLKLKAVEFTQDLQKIGYQSGLNSEQIKGIKSYADLAKYKTSAKLGDSLTNLTPAQQTRFFGLLDDFDKQTQNQRQIISSAGSISSIAERAKQNNASAQVALVYQYMKSLDPNSTVREGEYATAKNTAGVPARIRNSYNKVKNGSFLTSDQIDSMVADTTKLSETASLQIQDRSNEFDRRGSLVGIPAGLFYQTTTSVTDPAGLGTDVKVTTDTLKLFN